MSISGYFSYKDLTTMQHQNVKEVFNQLIKTEKPSRVLEIGTSSGGLTLIIRDVLDENNLHNTIIRTYDVYDPVFLKEKTKNNSNVDIRVENIFNHMYNDLIDSEDISNFIKGDGLTLVLCDGGSKKNEFKILSKFLKKGDIIMAHDYSPNEEFFLENIQGKIWNWLEIQDSDIEESVEEHGLEPFMSEEFRNIVWVCKKKENEELIVKKKEFSVLITSICFIDKNQSTSSDYILSAHKLINDIMTKTPYDFKLITNSTSDFLIYEKSSYSNRIKIIEDNLVDDQLIVGDFNQLLKYKIFFGIPSEYDWVLYLDCDAGFSSAVNHEKLKSITQKYYENGCDFLGTRTHYILKDQLIDHEKKIELCKNNNIVFVPWGTNSNLFSPKFVFYNLNSENIPVEWLDAKLPDEHMLFFKNSNKTEVMGLFLKDFCKKYETQLGGEIITISVEAFEIGISAKMAGYNVCDFDDSELEFEWNIIYNLNSINK